MIAGIRRTSLAMARNRDIPHWFAAVHPRFSIPYGAEFPLGLVVCLLIAVTDLRGAISFSSFGILLYYFVATIAAWTQTRENPATRVSSPLPGTIGCLILVVTLPLSSIIAGVIVLAVGLGYRLIRLRVQNPTSGRAQ